MPTLEDAFHRYPTTYGITSPLDPFLDVLTLVQSLSSTEYLTDVIHATHGLKMNDAVRRTKRIAPHIRTALSYIEQSAHGPRDVAFLPIYYALLNLAKVYILLGPRNNDLSANRWHGAVYEGHAKNSQSLLTEEIKIRRGGAIPLFYETLTGMRITRDTRVRMSDVLSFLNGVSAEFQLATGRAANIAELELATRRTAKGRLQPVITFRPLSPRPLRRSELKVLVSGFRADRDHPGVFTGPLQPLGSDDFGYLRARLRPYLLHRVGIRNRTPLCGRKLLLPEEITSLLMFFHLGSVARYKPEFLAKLRDSRFWPMLLAAQRHCLFNFLTLFWSFVHQQSLVVVHG